MEGSRWVVYTGTHDNPTTLGWWNALDDASKERITTRVNGPFEAPAWHLFDMAFATTAALVVAPLQDLLHLDDRARFNTPGTSEGNWSWRLPSFNTELEGALKGYGERGAVWGRSVECRSPGGLPAVDARFGCQGRLLAIPKHPIGVRWRRLDRHLHGGLKLQGHAAAVAS